MKSLLLSNAIMVTMKLLIWLKDGKFQGRVCDSSKTKNLCSRSSDPIEDGHTNVFVFYPIGNICVSNQFLVGEF